MIPSLSLSSSSSSSSSSSYSATVGVEKATSHLLIGPDWTMNMDICDSINSNHWDAKDVIKAVKKRLQHKNPKVQLLALTLLEAMVNNCGDYVHFQIAERNILQEMVKIVKKKTDMHVRDKILVLLDFWEEAFGGPGGKYPQYYWAYEDLRRSGVVFPQRSLDAAPIITPPVARSTFRHAQAGYGMPSNSSTRLDQAMAAEMETLSLSSINSMWNALDLLADMLQAVNPTDRASVKDEVIVDLVSQCRSNQKRLMQMLTTTGDEELLSFGLELNDNMQSVLAKHDAIASGSPLPTQVTNLNAADSRLPIQVTNLNAAETLAAPQSSLKPGEVKETIQTPIANPSVVASVRGQIAEEEDEEDDFTQLARRHSKPQTTISQDTSTSNSHHDALGNANDNVVSPPIQAAATAPVTSNALALVDPPVPIRATKEQDIIDLLSITLSTATASLPTPGSTPADCSQNIHQASVSGTTQEHPYSSHPHPVGHVQMPLNSYVVPWAQPQTQPQTPTQTQLHPQPQSQFYTPPRSQSQPQPQPQSEHYPQPPLQSQTRPQYPQYSSGYIPPPWAPTPGYYSNQNNLSLVPHNFPTPQTNTASSYRTLPFSRPLNSFPMKEETRVTTTAAAAGSKPYVPSYRLFEDLNVLGNGDGRFKMTSSTMPSLSGASSHSMVGGRK